MCWYELTEHFCGSSTCMVEWRSSCDIGVLCMCFQDQGPNQGFIYFYVGKLLSKDLSPPSKKNKQTVIGKRIENSVSLMKRLFSLKMGCSLLKKDDFLSKRVWYRTNFHQLHVHCFYHHRLQSSSPLKIPNGTLGRLIFRPEQLPHCSSFPFHFC